MASDTAPKTIVLLGGAVVRDGIAAGTITPGHMIARDTAGKWVVHATEGGDAVPYFAVELPFRSDLTAGTKAIDTNYASADTVRYVVAQRGDQIYALLPASAAAVVIGDQLTSKGDGTLKKYVPVAVNESGSTNHGTLYPAAIVARAVEAVDNSGNGASTARIRVEIL